MIKVAIATSSPEKILGINEAFVRFFNLKESEIQLYHYFVPSGVANQPFDEATYQGASNRVMAIKKLFPEMDFYVSCEAGIESQFGQYLNVQVVCILEANSNMQLWAKSAGWSLPAEDIEIIKNTTLDSYLRGKGLTCIEELLGPANSRRKAIAQATELALASGKLRNK